MESYKIHVSIIMPVYNAGIFLKKAVDSILNQTFKNFELILIDDGSTDGSSEMCDKYILQDKRVKVIHQKNGGICNARNAALKIARGKYIGFSDHDDEYVEGFLDNAYNEAIKNDADLVKVGKKEFIIKEDKLIRTKFSKLPYKVYNKNDIKKNYFNLIDSGELDCLWDALFKRDIIERYNIRLDENYKNGGEDIDFIQKFIIHVNTLVTIDKIYYNHYIRRGFSTSTKFNPDKIDAKNRLICSIQKTLNELNIDVNNFKFEYTYLLLRQYIAPVCSLYANKGCSLPEKEKKKRIKDIKKEKFFYDFCNIQNVYKICKNSKKYGLLYFLFKHGLYELILQLYRKRD